MRRIDDPQPGFFKTRLVRGGPFVGARIEHDHPIDPETGERLTERSPMWSTTINGKLARDPSPDPLRAGVFLVWCSAPEIDEREYRYLIDDREWAANHAPDDPAATPEKKVSIADLSPELFKL